MAKQKIDKNPLAYDLGLMAKAFNLKVIKKCDYLDNWLSAHYDLDTIEQNVLEELHAETLEDSGYWNEEELKIKFIGTIFRVAKVEIKERIKVFYERPLSAHLNGYDLSVVADCLIATPLPFNTVDSPYFFLQEFKKKRGEKKDPEAQMLAAMLISQHLNNDHKPLFGGYLFGSIWNFSVLNNTEYCSSRQFDTTQKADLLQIVFILRKVKELILNR